MNISTKIVKWCLGWVGLQTQMSVPNFVPIHLVDVNIFNWIINEFDLLLLRHEKSKGSPKSLRFICWLPWISVPNAKYFISQNIPIFIDQTCHNVSKTSKHSKGFSPSVVYLRKLCLLHDWTAVFSPNYSFFFFLQL